MKKSASIFSLLIGLSVSVLAQSNLTLEEEYDLLTSDWLIRSEVLREYQGITEYCTNVNFRESVNNVLNAIHHYDSLVLDALESPTELLYSDNKMRQKTLKDIHKFEIQYSARAFIDEMRDDCSFRNEIEANADELRNGVGLESYDGKVVILETKVQKYLNHVDKLVKRIDQHIHLL